MFQGKLKSQTKVKEIETRAPNLSCQCSDSYDHLATASRHNLLILRPFNHPVLGRPENKAKLHFVDFSFADSAAKSLTP